MKLLIGTVRRASSVREGGELLVLDGDQHRVRRRVPIAPADPDLDHDPNPRGNARGCRGIQLLGDEIFAADYHTIRVYDADLNLRRKFSHGLMVGLHETCLDGTSLWVTSTAIDAVLRYDTTTGELAEGFFPREVAAFQQAWETRPLRLDKAADCRLRFLDPQAAREPHHLHINAVAVREGRRLVLANRRGAIADLASERVLVTHEHLHGAHNLVFADANTLVANDSLGRCVRFFDATTGAETKVLDLMQYAWVRQLLQRCTPGWFRRGCSRLLGRATPKIARPLFVRGLDIHGDELFVGLSPASIVRINWRTGRMVDAIQLSNDVRDCVHGLRVAA